MRHAACHDARMTRKEAALLERASRLAATDMQAVSLQRRRLGTVYDDDPDYEFAWWVDLQFLIVALSRLRRSVSIALGIPSIAENVQVMLASFDAATPNLKVMRDTGEHI